MDVQPPSLADEVRNSECCVYNHNLEKHFICPALYSDQFQAATPVAIISNRRKFFVSFCICIMQETKAN